MCVYIHTCSFSTLVYICTNTHLLSPSLSSYLIRVLFPTHLHTHTCAREHTNTPPQHDKTCIIYLYIYIYVFLSPYLPLVLFLSCWVSQSLSRAIPVYSTSVPIYIYKHTLSSALSLCISLFFCVFRAGTHEPSIPVSARVFLSLSVSLSLSVCLSLSLCVYLSLCVSISLSLCLSLSLWLSFPCTNKHTHTVNI